MGGAVGGLAGKSLVSPYWLCEWCLTVWRGLGWSWFPHGTACVVCMCEWCGLRIELEVEIGCSVVGALVGGRCVGEFRCVRVYVFAE